VVTHIALFKFKKEISEGEINSAIARLNNLKSRIPEILEISAGATFSRYSEEFNHAVVVKFANREDFDTYRGHPEHKSIAEKLESFAKKSIEIDFES
jgi:hypothetical protein